jgi:putative ABC transport system substrate-binding protein
MRRRQFITLLGASAAAWPLAASAQQPPAMPVVGYLGAESPELWASRVRAFRQGLGEAGFVEGRNVLIEYRWAEGHNERFPALAADLVGRRVAVIAAPGSAPAAVAAKAATATIPIAFFTGGDPIELGLVTSLARPNANLTGVTNLTIEVVPKRLELLRELIPTGSAVAVLLNPTNPVAEAESRDLQAAARILGLQLHVLHARAESDFDAAFATLAQLRVRALVISPDALFGARDQLLAALALRHGLLSVHANREYVVAGGLMSYGNSFLDGHRMAGVYAGRLLKGEKPSDLPVMQSTRIEFIINMKTAKALGLDVPPSVLVRADEVIE